MVPHSPGCHTPNMVILRQNGRPICHPNVIPLATHSHLDSTILNKFRCGRLAHTWSSGGCEMNSPMPRCSCVNKGATVADAIENSSAWAQLSDSLSQTIDAMRGSVVAVYAGGRSTSSGVVWRPGLVVTTHSSLGGHETAKIIHVGEPVTANVIGRDAGTDLAILRLPSEDLKPVDKIQ